MPRLLLINPNTTAAVTERLATVARELAPSGAEVSARTARFGPAYISSETGAVLAAHAALDAWALDRDEHPHDPPAVILIGCFGDPGLTALRELAGVPVLGLAQASMQAAAERGPFAIVTGGAAWGPMLKRLAVSLDLAQQLVDVQTVDATGAELAADPEMALRVLRNASLAALAAGPVASIVVGGAALGGVAGKLQPDLRVPLIDSVRCGVQAAWASAATLAPRTPPTPTAWLPHHGVGFQGVDTLAQTLNAIRAG